MNIKNKNRYFMGKSAGKYACPVSIFQTCEFRRREMQSVAWVNADIMRAVCNSERTSQIVAPHNLPAKLLLRMRRQDQSDRAGAYGPAANFAIGVFAVQAERNTNGRSGECFIAGRSFNRTRLPARAIAAGDRTAGQGYFTVRRNRPSITGYNRTGPHLRRSHEERKTARAASMVQCCWQHKGAPAMLPSRS